MAKVRTMRRMYGKAARAATRLRKLSRHATRRARGLATQWTGHAARAMEYAKTTATQGLSMTRKAHKAMLKWK